MARVAKVFTGGVGPKPKEEEIPGFLGLTPGFERGGPAVERVPRAAPVLTGDRLGPEEDISIIGGLGAMPGAEFLEGPAVPRVKPTPPPRRLPMPPRPVAVEKAPVPEPKAEAPKGGFAFGRGGGVGVVPARETPEIERVGKFIDPTQIYTLGVGGVGKQDVIAGRAWRDLQEEKDLIKGTIAYREPGSKEGARVHKRLGQIAKKQGAIRTGIETGIRGEFEAKTKRGAKRSSAEAVRDTLEEKQRARIAEQEQFDIQEERLATTAAAGVGTERIKARAAFAGPRPNPADYFDPKEYQAALTAWQEQYKAAPVSGGVGAPVAAPQTESYTKYL